MKPEGLRQRIEKMRGPQMCWKPKQGGARMKKHVLTELDKTYAVIKEMRGFCYGKLIDRNKVLKALDSEKNTIKEKGK